MPPPPLTGWVGCYTSQSGGDSEGGIGRLAWGERLEVNVAVHAEDPSYLALSSRGDVLYAVHEVGDGLVSAYAAQGDSLHLLGTQSTGGAHPCHLKVDPTGRFVLVANYSSGSVAVLPVEPDGSLGPLTDSVHHVGSGPDQDRQTGPHAHMVTFDPSGSHVFVADLGIDAVVTYRLDDTGRLHETSRLRLRSGAGPRHLAFHPSGHAAYVVGELDSTLTACRHENGLLTPVSTVSTRVDAPGENLVAAVTVAPDGKRVRVTNRGDDTVATFDLAGGGLLVRLSDTTGCGGHWPRDLAQSAAGDALIVTNERSGSVCVFEVSAAGQPRFTSSAPYAAATCVVLAD